MLWPVSVTLDGVAVPLADVLADVTIHHGRTDAFDSPAASTCQLVLDGVTFETTAGFRVGGDLVLSVANGGAPFPRFTGRVTDASLDDDRLTVIAAGKLSELDQYEIGFASWPSEPWAARVTRIFAEAGLSSLLDLQAPAAIFNPTLAPRDLAQSAGGHVTLGDELAGLAAMVGAAVCDLPNGKILVQPLAERPFSSLDVPGHHGRLNPADVAYVPVWSQVLPAGNIVTVTYTPGDILPPRVGVLTDNSPAVTGLSSTLDILPGMPVSGVGIAQETVVQAVVSPSQIMLSRPANTSATKDGAVSPGETEIDSISDTSDLSVGMTVTAGGDLQAGTTVTEIRDHAVAISKPAVGTNIGQFVFSAPASSTLTFFAQTAYVTHRDEPSIAAFGERPAQVDTTFLYVADADRRATERLARTASPRWIIPAAPVLKGLELKLGYPVLLREMPASSPASEWLSLLEGWTETITGDDWTMELALSDPVLSGHIAHLYWNEVPADIAWDEVDPGCSWIEATSLEAITP